MSLAELFDEMRLKGFEPPANLAPGRVVRFPGVGKMRGTNGWARVFDDCLGAVYGDWAIGDDHVWQASRNRQQTAAEAAAFAAAVEAARRERTALRHREAVEAANVAQAAWESAAECTEHPYLTRKGVKAHGLRVLNGDLLVPMRDVDGKIWSYQAIGEASSAGKKFMPGGAVAGRFHLIGKIVDGIPLGIAEGYATAATIHEATGIPVVAAMNADGLGKVGAQLRKKYPTMRLAVFVDDDRDKSKEINPATGKPHDNAGFEKGFRAAAEIGAAIVVPVWKGPRPGGSTDFNDLARDEGVDAVKRLATGILGTLPAAHGPGRAEFVSSLVRVETERQTRIDTAPRVISFGVPFLDDAFTGIMPNDVVLLSAGPGVGKTEAASTIAIEVARTGKRVHFFALEAEMAEIEMRIKYRLVARAYYSDKAKCEWDRRQIRYQEWRAGLLDSVLRQYEEQTKGSFCSLMRNVHTLYKEGDYTGDDFIRDTEAASKDADLFILDHLMYFDHADENENRAYKRLMKQVRDCALKNGKPVVAVAHLRKADRSSQRLIPSLDEIHGSSDIGKIATKAIMIARAEDQESRKPTIANTYIQPVKNRTDGSVTRFAAMVEFDTRTNTYSHRYELFRPINGGREMAALTGDEMPHWARGASSPVDPQPSPPPAHEYDGNDFDPVTGEFR